MSLPVATVVLSLALYALAGVGVALRPQSRLLSAAYKLAAAALVAHFFANYFSFSSDIGGWQLELWHLCSALAWLLACAFWLLGARDQSPFTALFLAALPAVVLLLPLGLESQVWLRSPELGLVLHIEHSLLGLAVAVLSLGFAQLNSYQAQLMRRSQSLAVLRFLPPLLVLERLIFILIWQGFILLALGMLSGFQVALQHPGASALDWKIALSLAAWALLSGLLWRRYHSGWRGYKVSWAVALAVLLLLLALTAFELWP